MNPHDVTGNQTPAAARSHVPGLVLSIFPGIDLFGRAFELEGYHVLRGPDILWGGNIFDFFPPAGVFEGVIGGSPCQDFSSARRSPATGTGLKLLLEFIRIVETTEPAWFVLENVPQVPDVTVRGFTMQLFFLNARECGCRQNRHRRFQFGSSDGVGLVIPAPASPPGPVAPCAMATEGSKAGRRTWGEFVQLQGLSATFELPGLPIGMAYRAVGNGVPIPMGRVVAAAIRRRLDTRHARVCVCGCGRVPPAKALHASAACRKRTERSRRDSAGGTGDRAVTASQDGPAAADSVSNFVR